MRLIVIPDSVVGERSDMPHISQSTAIVDMIGALHAAHSLTIAAPHNGQLPGGEASAGMYRRAQPQLTQKHA